MGGSLRMVAVMFGLALLVSTARADLIRPPGGPAAGQPGKPIPEDMGKVLSSKKAVYTTTFDPKATRTKLVIPQKFLVGGNADDKEAPKTGRLVPGQTLFAGVALSLGLVSGGVWWTRRKNGGLGKGKTALLIVFGVLGVSALATSVLWADISGFPGKDKGKGFGPGGFVMPKQDIDVEVTENGDTIYFVIGGGALGNPGNPLLKDKGPPRKGAQEE